MNLRRVGVLRAFDALGRAAAQELRLCDELEAAADALPALGTGQFATILRALRREPPAAEMDAILRIVLDDADAVGDPPEPDAPCLRMLRLAVQRFQLERQEDADARIELIAALEGEGCEAEALGRQLRSYFSARRRHVAWLQATADALALPLSLQSTPCDSATAVCPGKQR